MRLFRRNCWKRVIHCWRKCQPKAAEVQLPRFDHFISFSLGLLALFFLVVAVGVSFLFLLFFFVRFAIFLRLWPFRRERMSQNRGGMGRKAHAPSSPFLSWSCLYQTSIRQFSNTSLVYCWYYKNIQHFCQIKLTWSYLHFVELGHHAEIRSRTEKRKSRSGGIFCSLLVCCIVERSHKCNRLNGSFLSWKYLYRKKMAQMSSFLQFSRYTTTISISKTFHSQNF